MILLLDTKNKNLSDLILKLAQELNIKVKLIDDEKDEKEIMMKYAETSFKEEWNSPENEHWDSYLKSK